MTTAPSARLVESPDPGIGSAEVHADAEPAAARSKRQRGPQPGETPANSRRMGSFLYDQERGGFPMQWKDASEFETWCREEELAHSIQFISHRVTPGNWLYLEKRVYVCSRQLSGGKSAYHKKHPD